VPGILIRLCAAALALVATLEIHAQSPARLPPVAVTANPLGSDLFDMVQPVSVLSGERLMLNMQPTLGELVNQIVGVNSSYYGPNASRPVIRGLDGDRVQILQNGLASFDASGTSVDHAVALDTLTLKRVEVVRGPAVLLYGPTAIGGAVNTIDGRIPNERIEGVQGGVDLKYASAAKERAAAGLVEFGLEQGLQFHADGFTRRTSDLKIPGYANSPQLRSTLPPDEQGPFGTLPNSASNSDGGSFGASYVGTKGFVGGSYTRFNSDYGTVAEPDVTIKMKQERVDLAGQLLSPTDSIKSVDAKFVTSRYEHTEFEGSEAGTTFKNKGFQGRIDAVHNKLGAIQGAFGVQYVDFDFSALGEEGFLPETNTRAFAAFVYEEMPLDRWKLSIGARYDNTRVAAQEDPNFGPALTRTFNSGAVSLGATYSLTQQYALVGSVAYTQRPPNYQELFADGPHLATGIFEVGDRNLGLEKSVGVDLALRRRGDNWTGSLGAFYNKFSNYITLYNSGLIDPEFEIPIYFYRASAAVFYGLEAQATINLGEYGPGRFDLELQADYLWAANTDLNEPLPRISPVRIGGSLVYTASQWDARLDVFRVQSQDRVAPNELPTDGYTMLNASFTYRLTRDRYGLTAFVKGTNLLDQDARNHVSFLANIAPMAARGVTVGLRGTF
jgi:iron complex outermembrane recepter protein